MPQIGERHDDGVGHVLVWTGSVWTAVCPPCDEPMADHDSVGWLRCGRCGLRAADAKRVA